MNSPIISINPRIMSDEIQRLKEGTSNAFRDIWEMNTQTGVKNLLVYPYDNTTKTHHNITFTDNGDGSITVSGTSDAVNANFFIQNINYAQALALPVGKYKISLQPASDKVRINVGQFASDGTNTLVAQINGGHEAVFEAKEGYHYSFVLQVPTSGSEFTEAVRFYPMLRYSEDIDSTWEPYVLSNKQLTDDVNALKCTKTTAGSYYLTATVDASGNITYSWEVIE